MKIALIHLSDIHFKSNNNSFSDKIPDLIHTVKCKIDDGSLPVFLITGDIAFSGKEAEYEEAIKFLTQIKSEVSTSQFVACPGNHDCDFSHVDNASREVIVGALKSQSANYIDENVVENCCKAQSSFDSFQDDLASLCHTPMSKSGNHLIRIFQLTQDKETISFKCFNTAWVSELDEKPGTLFLPMKNLSFRQDPSDLSVSLFHHPLNWLRADNAHQWREFLTDNSDLIMSGHEHHAEKYSRDNLEGNTTLFMEGAELQNTNDSSQSGFNFVFLDTSERTFEIGFYVWDNDEYILDKTVAPQKYGRSEKLEQGKFHVSSEYSKFLDEPGMAFSHPQREELHLSDFYVFPELQSLSFSNGDLTRKIISSESLLAEDAEDKHILIYGIESSGKTALCKKMFLECQLRGLVPVIVDGKDIKQGNLEAFKKGALKRAYLNTFKADNYADFGKKAENNGVLIIDNFDHCKLSAKLRNGLLNDLAPKFSRVIIMANDTLKIDEIFEHDKETNSQNFVAFDLLELGHLHRHKLIEKWTHIGLPETAEDADIIRKVNATRALVDEIIGSRLMPSTPFFVLAIIQMAESGEKNLHEGNTNGDYYSFLITQALEKAGIENHNFSAVHSYLTELAFFYFQSNSTECNKADLEEFHTTFLQKYDLSGTDVVFGQSLVRARILCENAGLFSFRYTYVYFFYVAKYFSKNCSDHNIRKTIKNMCAHLYMPVYANIIMFMTYDTNNGFIIDEIASNANKLFADNKQATLENDIKDIDRLAADMPEVVFEETCVRKQTETRLQSQDYMARQIETVAEEGHDDLNVVDIDEPVDIAELDVAAQMNMSFKTTEVIGQVLRGHYASLNAKVKADLCNVAYELCLRSLTEFLKEIQNVQDWLVVKILDRISEEKQGDKNEIEKVARSVVFGLCATIVHVIIKKTADSVGSEHLSKTYARMINAESSTSQRLLDLSIKFEFFKHLPLREIIELQKKIGTQILPQYITKILAVEHLHKFKRNISERDRLVKSVGISQKTRKSIILSNATKKPGGSR
jgi:predicted MPP superfamily phosphohydrolase